MIIVALVTGGAKVMLEIPSWALAIIISALGLMMVLIGFLYNKQKDIVAKAKEDGALMTEMKYISRTIDSMNATMCSKFGEAETRIKLLETESNKRIERLIPLEMKADAYGIKLDNHEGRITKLEGKEG